MFTRWQLQYNLCVQYLLSPLYGAKSLHAFKQLIIIFEILFFLRRCLTSFPVQDVRSPGLSEAGCPAEAQPRRRQQSPEPRFWWDHSCSSLRADFPRVFHRMPFLLFSAGRDFGGAEETEPWQKLLLQDEVSQTAPSSEPPRLPPLHQAQLCDPTPLQPHRRGVTLRQAHRQPSASHHLLYLQRPAPRRQREQEEQGPAPRRFREGAGPDGGSGEDPQAQAGGCGDPQRACRQDSSRASI